MQSFNDSMYDFNALASSFRKEIEEYGLLLNLIYEQQNCLMSHNPISLIQATAQIEEQLPQTQAATADRAALFSQLAELKNTPTMTVNELPNNVPAELSSMFKALVEEIISLRYRIKSKTQLQQRLLAQAQLINGSVLKQINPQSQIYNKSGKTGTSSVFKETL